MAIETLLPFAGKEIRSWPARAAIHFLPAFWL
jgi:hypothetical protein